jgi:hypothetical protein
MASNCPTLAEMDRVAAFDTAFWEHPMHKVIRRVSELSGADEREVERVAYGLVEGLGKELEPFSDALQTISKRTRLDLTDVGEAAYRANSNLGLAPLNRVKKPPLRDLLYILQVFAIMDSSGQTATIWQELWASQPDLMREVGFTPADGAIVPPEPVIFFLGPQRYRFATEEVCVESAEDNVLQVFLMERGPVDKGTLIRLSGQSNAPRVLNKLREKHPTTLGRAIRCPARKGRGGYYAHVRIAEPAPA